MGNSVSNSKDRHGDEVVDYGYLTPQGVYTGPQDWNHEIVANLIIDRKLAPFYRPLEDYNESWDDERILAARKEIPGREGASSEAGAAGSNGASKSHHHKQANKSGKEPFRPTEASVYRGAVECPICFLYYPPNINRSRCCDQAICTECFVQIKRTEPTTTHLVSEPASCPYCVQENFGVTYEPPPWRTGLVRDGSPPPTSRPDMHKIPSGSSTDSEGRRRKSFSADAPEVVTIDHIRPDWEAKLAAVRAAVARRANRRIIMRQVGDRLIPIGITSGRIVQENAEGSGEGEQHSSGSGSRRRRRHQQGPDINQLLGSVGLGPLAGQDLEELMVMEAMRISLLEHEEQQRRQQTEQNASNANNANTNQSVPSDTNNAAPTPIPAPTPSTAPAAPTEQSQISLSPSTTSSPPSRPRSPFQLAPSTDSSGHQRRSSIPAPTPTLAAALAAAQTASAFLNAQEERTGAAPAQSITTLPRASVELTPRASRAATPDPTAGPAVVEEAPGASGASIRENEGEHDTKAAVAGTEVVAPSTPTAASTSALEEASSSAAASSSLDTPASEVASMVDKAFAGGYEPLPSSMESSDPLLSKADEVRQEPRTSEEGRV